MGLTSKLETLNKSNTRCIQDIYCSVDSSLLQFPKQVFDKGAHGLPTVPLALVCSSQSEPNFNLLTIVFKVDRTVTHDFICCNVRNSHLIPWVCFVEVMTTAFKQGLSLLNAIAFPRLIPRYLWVISVCCKFIQISSFERPETQPISTETCKFHLTTKVSVNINNDVTQTFDGWTGPR